MQEICLGSVLNQPIMKNGRFNNLRKEVGKERNTKLTIKKKNVDSSDESNNDMFDHSNKMTWILLVQAWMAICSISCEYLSQDHATVCYRVFITLIPCFLLNLNHGNCDQVLKLFYINYPVTAELILLIFTVDLCQIVLVYSITRVSHVKQCVLCIMYYVEYRYKQGSV